MLAAAALTGCTEDPRPSVEQIVACAGKAFADHTGTFSRTEDGSGIAYSVQSPNGPARVVVTFDANRAPVNTVTVSAPHETHRELVDAAQVIRTCSEPRPPEASGTSKSLVSGLKS